MVTRVNSTADYYVPAESDITGADATNDGTSSGNASSTVVLPVGFFNSTLPTITTGNAGALQIDASGRLIIAPLPTGSNVIGSISNTAFTANAGTNLNTSALALESGGNLAGINTKLPSNLTVTSTRLLVDGSGVTQPVSDGGGTLTVDAPVGTPVFVRLSDGTSAIATLPISGTVTANAGTNLNTSALATSANQTSQSTLFGAVTETAPATDTASSGLNGRLQRIAQRLTTLLPIAYNTTTTITRAANTTPYTANDVIGGALTIASAGPTAGTVALNSIRMILNITAVPSGMGPFFLFLYDVTPPSAVADNGAFTVASGDRASLLTPNGIALGTPVLGRGGGTVVLQATNLALQFKLAAASTSFFAYLVTEGAFTPAANSETYTMTCQFVGL